MGRKKLYLIIFIFFFSGCIRLSAKAGYSYQGAKDETPKTKQVGFDTQDLVQYNKAPENITP